MASESEATNRPLVRLLVAAMAKKAQSRPMTELLHRLSAYGELEVEVLPQNVVLDHSAEHWPPADALIAFVSKDYPLDKAIAYSRIHSPFLVNDLESQRILLDRREVLRLLDETNVPTPGHFVLTRKAAFQEERLQEFDDYISFDGNVMQKPLVEKPVDGNNHNVSVYYPSSQGGGCRQLFRKVNNRSSAIVADGQLRRHGSFIYERFVQCGRDIKVYSVGPHWAYAESRKSPTVDGIVERNRLGRERRQFEHLTPEEREMIGQVVQAFKQNVCGLDVLRDGDKSYVIDVNGWSFVKGSPFYYDHCASLLRSMILGSEQAQAVFHHRAIAAQNAGAQFVDRAKGDELLGIFAVFRHADRTPKQKLKFRSSEREIVQLAYHATKEKPEVGMF